MNDKKDPALVDLPGAIAVIGMAGRFPGARNLAAFRRNLELGVESITVLSDEELLQAGVPRARLSQPNYVKAVPLLEDADQFDASFFEYSPREAVIMDPQQRLFLECAWEALEDAGHAGDVSGSNTGVFSGAGGVMSTYLVSDTHFNPQLTGTTASLEHVGNDKDYLSTRVSYKLNLRGPSLTVQTACSTSLVAIHLACQSLLNRECDMALAGGTTVRVPQRTGYFFKEGNVFSQDGHCRAFDAGATGTVFGSGIGVVVLKRLKDAIADGDPIHAVVRGTAINNDGSENKSSYWAPHAEGQADAMRRALASAQVEPHTIGYVEAHGTATRRGDPTEIRALRDAFGAAREGRCAIGSVKSNIGHPESAAGVAGFIKAVLSLEHNVLFPSLHYSRPNPEAEFGDGFYVNTSAQPWEERPFPRRAGVNSLGIGGTNAFVILEEAPHRKPEPRQIDRPCHVLTLSAKSAASLDASINRFTRHLRENTNESFADVCYTANVGRAHFQHRVAVVASDAEEAIAQLDSVRAGSADLVRSAKHVEADPRIAFLFTGQGSQYAGMARELYATNATFRDAFDRCAEKFGPYLSRPLASVVYPSTEHAGLINETAFTQPALFAIEYALATLWQSWGIRPSLLAGHSVGELVAACVAGVFTLDDAARLVAERGRLMQALPAGGGMAAVRCDAAQVTEAVARYPDTVSIAAINGPTEVVISGRLEDVETIVTQFEQSGITATRLTVSHAFHSPLMDAMLADFARVAEAVTCSLPTIPLISNVTGELAGPEIATPEYWVRHIRESVRFADGIAAAHRHGIDVLLEVGPSPVLIGLARQCLPTATWTSVCSLRNGRSDWRQIGDTLAALYTCGASIDWAAFDREYGRQRVHLPTYPFEHKRYWMDPPAASAGPAIDPQGALLGRRVRLPRSVEVRFETRWSRHAPPYLDDHRVFDAVVVPGASHLAMVLTAAKELSAKGACVIEDVVFPQALTLGDDESRTAQLVLETGTASESSFQVMSLREGEDENENTAWVVHAAGRLRRQVEDRAADRRVDLTQWQTRCPRSSSGAEFYGRFWESGYHLRGAFRWIDRIWAGSSELLCELRWPDVPDDPTQYPLYPSLIDSCFQCVFSDAASALLKPDAVYVPFSVARFTLHDSPQRGARLWCHVALSPLDEGGHSVDADITLTDDNGRVLAAIERCQLREVRRDALLHDAAKDLRDALYSVQWRAGLRPSSVATLDGPGSWIVFADAGSPDLTRSGLPTSAASPDLTRLREASARSGLPSAAFALIERLRAHNQRCIRVDCGAAAYRQVTVDHYEIGTAVDDVHALLRDALADRAAPLRGVVHLWSLDTSIADASSAARREHAIGSVLHLLQALAKSQLSEPPRLWLVTRGSQSVDRTMPVAVQQAPLWGLGRVVALEHPEAKCVCVDLDPSPSDADARQLFDEIAGPDQQDQVAYRQQIRYVPRLVRWSAAGDRRDDLTSAPQPVRVRLSNYGLDNLALRPMTRRAPRRGDVEIEVRASGLNFRDVLNALGLLKEHYAAQLGITSAADMAFGFECAGLVAAVGEGVTDVKVGDEVMAIATHESLASFITLPREFVVSKPDGLTFEEAATLPLAFLTAHYGLERLAKLRSGERVLIHAAAGGVGLACVQLAQRAGARGFATASPAKWEFLRSIGVERVMSSRTLDFAATIAELTSGEGVDVIVNTLSGEFVDRSFAVLTRGGRFIELGKRDVWSQEKAGERRPDVAYFPFDLVSVAQREPQVIASMLDEMHARLRSGALAPLRHVAFAASQVREAFRHMAEARHIGKIVVSMPSLSRDAHAPTKGIRGDATYLITGGLGALGLEIASWLVANGARHIVLTSRRQVAGPAEETLARLREAGANVMAVAADVADATQLAGVLDRITDTCPPLRGIVHAAGVLDDGVLLQQTWERFKSVMAPKVDGAWNLHAMTRDLPLDFFVCFSSIASLLGSAGQGNYAAGNAFMDALAHDRRAQGLPALSINWGPWGEVGMAAEGSAYRQRRFAEQGFRLIAPEHGVRVFGDLLTSTATQIGVVTVNWSEILRVNPSGRPFLDTVATQADVGRRDLVSSGTSREDIRQQLASAADPRVVLARHVRSAVGKVLGIRNPEEIDARARLFDLGLESLMAVELRARFEESLGCPLRPTLVFDYPTIESLTDHLAGKIAPSPEPAARVETSTFAKPTVDKPASAEAIDLETLTEDELADRLAEELSALDTRSGR
jgi:myxalamid-type polyketide synthase MxaB